MWKTGSLLLEIPDAQPFINVIPTLPQKNPLWWSIANKSLYNVNNVKREQKKERH